MCINVSMQFLHNFLWLKTAETFPRKSVVEIEFANSSINKIEVYVITAL